MGALKKLFKIQETTAGDNKEILEKLGDEDIKIFQMSERLTRNVHNIKARLLRALKIYHDKRSDKKPIPPELFEKLDYLEMQLGLENKKIEEEILVEAKDLAAVRLLLEKVEYIINNM